MPLIITAVHCTEYEFSNSYLRCSQASRWDGIDMVCHTVPFVEDSIYVFVSRIYLFMSH